MGERLKKLRNFLGLTQEEFAKRLHSAQNTITGYETGRRVPSKQMVALICSEFNVSESWLLEGTGKMFIPVTRDGEIEKFVCDVLHEESSAFKKRFISVLARLNESEWKFIEDKLLELAGGARSDEDDIDREVEDYRRELEAEKRDKEVLSASQNTEEA